MQVRHDWTQSQVKALFEMPFNDLLFQAATVHRSNFKPNEVQISTLLSIKTGACPEDCKYCPQSAHNKTGLAVKKKGDWFRHMRTLIKNPNMREDLGNALYERVKDNYDLTKVTAGRSEIYKTIIEGRKSKLKVVPSQ